MAATQTAPAPEELVKDLLLKLELKAERLEVSKDELEELGVFDSLGIQREEWAKLDPVLAEEYRNRAQERTRIYVQSILRERLIDDWLAKHTTPENKSDGERIKSTIEVYLQEDRREELAQYLVDFLTLGREQADKKRKREQRGGDYVGHAWAVVAGLGRLILVLGIFAAAQSNFETIVLALLVLLYNGIDAAYRSDRYYTMLMAFGIDSQFKRVLLKLKRDEPRREREQRIEQERKTNLDGSRGIIRFYISSTFIWLTWLLAMFNLVGAVLS